MNTFDVAITTFFNRFSQHSLALDDLMVFLSGNNLLKGGVLVTIIWWSWFDTTNDARSRERILSTLVGCVLSMVVARILAKTLPFRLRPLHEPSLHLLIPDGVPSYAFDGWSSLPSDHAALFFSLSTGILFFSRRAGVFSLLYTTLVIALPRIYLGLHYTTDILAGAVIGATVATLCNLHLFKIAMSKAAAIWLQAKPAVFYPLFFLFTYQVADMFETSRSVVSHGAMVARFLSTRYL